MNTAVILLVPFLALTTLTAQGNVRTFGATRTTSYGEPLAGGTNTISANGVVSTPATVLGTTQLALQTNNVSTVRLLGFSTPAASMSAMLTASHFVNLTQFGRTVFNSSGGSLQVMIGGVTVRTNDLGSITSSGNLVADVFPHDSVTYELSLLGFGIQLIGNATARATYELTPLISFTNGMTMDLTGPMRGSAVGSARASVSFLGASSGVQATLTYSDTRAAMAMHVTPEGATGSVAFAVQPIRLVMRVFANLALPFLPVLSTSMTLFDYSLPAQSGTLTLVEN